MAKKYLQLANGKRLRIKLVQGDEGVRVIGMEDDGDEWSLLILKGDGTFHRSTYVNVDGTKLDDLGRLVETPETFF